MISPYITNLKGTNKMTAINFDKVTVEKVLDVSPSQVLSKSFPSDEKCMNVADSFKSFIPPPKAKRQAKPKAEKKAKPKSKVTASTENTALDMSK